MQVEISTEWFLSMVGTVPSESVLQDHVLDQKVTVRFVPALELWRRERRYAPPCSLRSRLQGVCPGSGYLGPPCLFQGSVLRANDEDGTHRWVSVLARVIRWAIWVHGPRD